MAANPITIEALEILDAIDRRGSFSKAAEELNKATSALSYGVQKLEEQLDITIFERQGRRSVLTPAGRLVLEEGRKIITTTLLLAARAKEVATGWEPTLRIAVEAIANHGIFFRVIENFLAKHESIELDVSECVLSGGWDALEQDQVDLIVGAPGPVPLQKGFRAVPIITGAMVPVISAIHPLAHLAHDPELMQAALPKMRRVVTHDTSTVNVGRSAGLSAGKQNFYVQTTGQKIEAQLAGIGIGHLPRHLIQGHLDSGRFIELQVENTQNQSYVAWKISNKGKALKTLASLLVAEKW